MASAVSQALRDEPLTAFGDGSQTRSFCFVDDLIEGIYRLLRSDHQEPMNIGNPAEMTVLEFAREVLRITDSKAEVVFEPLPVDDPKVRQPDISLARQVLGWEPRVTLADGLQATVDYFAVRLGSSD